MVCRQASYFAEIITIFYAAVKNRGNKTILSQLLFIAVEGNPFKIMCEKQCNK